MKLSRWFLFLFSCSLFACTIKDEINIFEEIPNQKWEYSFIPKADVPIHDAKKNFNIYLNFKHNHTYPYSNLFYVLEVKGNDSLILSERFEIKLAKNDGKWLGKGSGSQYTYEDLILESFQFPDTGMYTIEISQNMRENPLNGVVAAGVRVLPN